MGDRNDSTDAELRRSAEENEKLRAAIELLWLIALDKETHLGYERFSGIEQECPACICALALGKATDEATAEDFDAKIVAIRERLDAEHVAGAES